MGEPEGRSLMVLAKSRATCPPQRSNVQGVVIGKFVIDTTGLADMRSFEVLRSDHEGFTTAVREALPAMRFHPAEVGGRRVKQLVQMPFSFSISMTL